ncbi:MAG: hypothetical protein ACLQU3_32715 [Limisphaerales bacterium]
MSTFKIIGASVTILGIVLSVVDRLKSPSYLLLEQSPKYQAWLGWAALLIAAAGTVMLILA